MQLSPDLIYHITALKDWEAAQAAGSYRADSLQSEGFIHASTAAQVIHTANRYYQGQHGLILLAIDPAKVSVEIRYENLTGGEERFPHLYGPLALDAVVRVEPIEPGPDGTFTA
jgi:uncharacterized protein (DUF952 family)